MNIFPDYIDAAREMYDKFGVEADLRAVETFDYRDPLTLRSTVLKVFWKIKVTSSGSNEVWSVLLPKSNVRQYDECDIDGVDELRGAEFDSGSFTKWNIDFQAQSGIIISAKTKRDLFDAIADCRECIMEMEELVSFAA